MQWKNDHDTYGLIARALHWVLAVLIIFMLWRGYFSLHKATGLVILALVLIRLGWRLWNTQPQAPVGMNRVERILLRAGHDMLYLLILLISLSGWARSMLAGKDVSFFGLVTIPTFFEKNMALSKLCSVAHYWMTQILIVVVAGHVLAALYHHFILKDNVLKRMSWGAYRS